MPSQESEAVDFPPENVVEMRLVLRGDNFIYYGRDKIAHVRYVPGKPPKWQATCLVGVYATRQTPTCESKFEVLQCVWAHRYLDTLF